MKTRRQFLIDAGFLSLGLLGSGSLAACAPGAAGTSRVYRLGIAYIQGTVASKNAFLGQLGKLGYVEGRNILAEMRDAGGDQDRLAELLAEIIQWRPDVIYASGTQVVIAAKAATTTIPIVGLAADPVGTGIVPSLARPGGNVTGVSLFANQLAAKRAQFLNEVLPGLRRVGVLYNPDDPSRVSELQDTQELAPQYDWRIAPIPIRFKEEIPDAFRQAESLGVEGLLVLLDPLTLTQARTIATLALEYGLPGMYGDARFAGAGGLMGYSASSLEQQAKAAEYVDKILRGAQPATLAIQQPTRFDLVLNTSTAAALGIDFPASIVEKATDIVA